MLTSDEILALGEFLEDRRDQEFCCRGLQLTKAWLKQHRGRVDPALIHELDSQGISCDCECIQMLYRPALRENTLKQLPQEPT
jgi:hypothetical protein